MIMKSSSGKRNSGGDCKIGFEVSQGGGDADSTNVELLKDRTLSLSEICK